MIEQHYLFINHEIRLDITNRKIHRNDIFFIFNAINAMSYFEC